MCKKLEYVELKNPSILQEAEEITSGERSQAYGDPAEMCDRIAKLWSAILGVEVTRHQVNLCMIAMKIARECNAHKRDNLVDIAGYAYILQKIYNKEENNNV